MSMRTFRLFAASAIALSACAPESGPPEGESIECALEQASGFSSQCVLEVAGEGRFTIHHPDGSFVRVSFNPASGLLSVSDGAFLLEQTTKDSDNPLEFSTGPNRYRISRDLLTKPAS
ncbi:MAG: hypothetical protein AAFR64_11665 [Pseudomonadota bacterium]